MPFVSVAQAFDYDAAYGDLITVDTLIPAAEKLVHTIECVGKLSAKSGGQGKVVVIGYSLGGLVSRLALNQVPTTKRAWKYVSQVITIGTPHKGLTDPFTQIYVDNLPKFSGDIDAVAIGGAVTKIEHHNNGNTKITKVKGDGLVSAKSATTGYVKSGNGLHWTYTYECDQEFDQGQQPPVVGCQHDRLIQDTSNGIAYYVARSIFERLDSGAKTTEPRSYKAGNLTITMDDNWTGDDYGASGVGMDVFAMEHMTNTSVLVYYYGLDCMRQADNSCLPLDPIPSDSSDAPKLKVGGETPSRSVRYPIDGYPNRSWGYLWCFTVSKVCVEYARGGDNKNLKLSPEFKELMANARWAK